MRRPTLRKVRDWKPEGQSYIRELQPTVVEEEEDTRVYLSSPPPPPRVPRLALVRERDDEALGALVGAYEKRSQPPPPPVPVPAPAVSERRAIVRRTLPSPPPSRESVRARALVASIAVLLLLDRAVRASEAWLGSLDARQRVVFVATSAIVASLATFIAR